MSWFAEGYNKVDEVAKEIEERRNQVWVPDFYLTDGDEARITFLTETPITYYQHFLGRMQGQKTFTCTQDESCPICAIGNKPSFRGAFLVIDHREDEWKDKQSGETKTAKYQVKLMNHGITALQVIEKKNNRHGLLNHDWVVTRTGTGSNTAYDFERLDDVSKPGDIPFPEELPELKELLKPVPRKSMLRKLAENGYGQVNAGGNPQPNTGGGEDIKEDDEVITFD